MAGSKSTNAQRQLSAVPRSPASKHPDTDLEYLDLLVEQVRAVADLVLKARAEELFSTTVSQAMGIIVGNLDTINELTAGLAPHFAGHGGEVLNG